MRLSAILVVVVTCVVSAKAEAAGFRFIDIPADANGPALTGAVWSPCDQPPQQIRVGPVTIAAARNCPVTGERLPLIVMSHGSGGWFGAHRDTAAALADAGFVVAAVDHPGDNAADRSRIDTLSILVDRPVDIRRLTDFMLDAWPEAFEARPWTHRLLRLFAWRLYGPCDRGRPARHFRNRRALLRRLRRRDVCRDREG